MRLWWYLLHDWVGLAAGSVVCWWKNDHMVSWQVGVLPATTWGGFTLNDDSDPSSNLYWERTYCIRCGVTLKDETS